MNQQKSIGRTVWNKLNFAWKLGYYEVAALKHHCLHYMFRTQLAYHKAVTRKAGGIGANYLSPQGGVMFVKAAMARQLAKRCRNEQKYLLTGRDYWVSHDMLPAVIKLYNLSPDGEDKMESHQISAFQFVVAELPNHAIEPLKSGVNVMRKVKALEKMQGLPKLFL